MLFRFANLPQYHAPLSNSPVLGRVRIHLSEVDSTNNYARQLLQDSLPVEGTLITASNQTTGRGQRQRQWESAPNYNITASYILRPVFLAADRQFMLSAAVALGVHDTILNFYSHFPAQVRIKWPNDLLVGTQKIAGILIENTLRGKSIDASIVGIGVNVNQVDFSADLKATSLVKILGEDFDLDEVLTELNQNLDNRYIQLKAMGFERLMEHYNALLFCRGEKVLLHVNGIQEVVKVLGAQNSGLLNLLHSDGRVSEHAHHEIGWEAVR